MKEMRADGNFSLLACALRLGDILQKVSNSIHDKMIPEKPASDMITAISSCKIMLK